MQTGLGRVTDGYPIYALYGFKDATDASSPIVELTSSYSVKPGGRLGDNNQPVGIYDGTFTADYEYLGHTGTLDECNGQYTVTPEFPQGTLSEYRLAFSTTVLYGPAGCQFQEISGLKTQAIDRFPRIHGKLLGRFENGVIELERVPK